MLQILRKTIHLPSLRRHAATQAAIKTKHTAKSKTEDRPALIQCKRKSFNIYKPLKAHCKFGTVPLSTSGWLNNKAKGDWFQINATLNEQDKYRTWAQHAKKKQN